MARPSWQTGIRAHSQEGWELQLKAEIDFFTSIVFLNPPVDIADEAVTPSYHKALSSNSVDRVTRRVTVLFCSMLLQRTRCPTDGSIRTQNANFYSSCQPARLLHGTIPIPPQRKQQKSEVHLTWPNDESRPLEHQRPGTTRTCRWW